MLTEYEGFRFRFCIILFYIRYDMKGEILMEPKKKIVAGLLGLFLGGFGAHQFYLGNTKRGIIQLIVTCVTC